MGLCDNTTYKATATHGSARAEDRSWLVVAFYSLVLICIPAEDALIEQKVYTVYVICEFRQG